MGYKPQDLFIGVIDLFVIILPGALLIFTALRVVYGYPLSALPPATWSDFTAVAAFAGGAYLLGHLVSGLGSVLEDALHELVKTWTLQRDAEVRQPVTTFLSQAGLPAGDAPGKVRRWAATYLRLHDPVAAAHIDRKDADRRFFRNVTVVLVFPVIAFLWRGNGTEGVFWGALFVASIFRYFDQQRKYTRDVFEYFLLSTGPGAKAKPPA